MKIRLIILCLFGFSFLQAQPYQPTSSEILLKLKKLNVLGSVLYVAAHPDDENTRLIGYLSREALVNTAYLSLTRGDGGQNLVGHELREGLGLIRTHELLAARSVDGSQQFFTRANDFGYSKTPKETLAIWDKDDVLHDMVWVIRKFKPDVIVTRFSADRGRTHGHHTSSAILADEAFEVAASNQYKDQLKQVKPWQATRIMVNTGRWWDPDIDKREGVVKVDIGTFNPLLGKSYNELAAESRTMHKSQGFGSMASRGEQIEYLSLIKGKSAENSLFDGIDMTWNRVGHPQISSEVEKIISEYKTEDPGQSVAALLELRKSIQKIEDDFWRAKKLNEVEDLIFDCSGLFVAVWAGDYAVVPQSTLKYNVEVVNRSINKWKLKMISVQGVDSVLNLALSNKREVIEGDLKVEENISGPYWLEKPATLGMYSVDDPDLIGQPENNAPFSANIVFQLNGQEIIKTVPFTYHWRDRVHGEIFRPVTVVSPVFLNLSNQVYIFRNGEKKTIEVKVQAGTDNVSGKVKLQVPKGWNVSPDYREVSLAKKWQSSTLKFDVTPSATNSGQILASITIGDKVYDRSIQTIEYTHIPYQIMLPKAMARVENITINNYAKTIGYIMGAGDQVPESLEQIGVKVWTMGESDVTMQNLKQLDAMVIGIRAVNTVEWIESKKEVLHDYMKSGGTVIMQYNTTRGINWQDFAPYELKFNGRSASARVAEEDAEIRILEPDHPVINFPNKITDTDFDGWVQERGLYFPSEWAPEYKAILSSNDEGEEALDGGLLIAKVGEGYFVYTGYSWFRELPAGVPGAYRLFANILSLGDQIKTVEMKSEKKRKSKKN
ncbi:MAG: PIG-L family deacetylase [Bacteroidota bacterium]